MRLKVLRPFKDMGVWKKEGDYVEAEGWRASKLLQQGLVGMERETAQVRAPERAVIPEPEPKQPDVYPRHVGGGWWETADGRRLRRAELESG